MPSPADRQPAAQIKIPGLRLVWRPQSAPPDVKWRLQLFGHVLKGTPHRLILFISLRGLLAWSTGTAAIVYFLGAAVLAWLWGQNPYNQISYADMVLPTRWSRLSEKRGQGQIDEGIHDLRTGNYVTGLMLLNHGLSLKPAELRGRMVLAQAFINAGYLHRGFQLLQDGLPYGASTKTYREAFFRLASYLEDYQAMLTAVDQIESRLPPGDTAARHWLLQQRVVAWEKLQLDDEIEHRRAEQKSEPVTALEAAWARVQLRRNRPAEALREIERAPDRFGTPPERYALQIALARAAKDNQALATALRGWLLAEPKHPMPRIEEIYAAALTPGAEAAVVSLLRRYFGQFGPDPGAAVLLLQKLDELPDVRWLQLGWQAATEAGVKNLNLHVLYVQGLIGHGEIATATKEYELVRDLMRQGGIQDGGWGEGTRILLELLGNDSPSTRNQLLAYCTRTRLNPAAYRFILRGLKARGLDPVMAEVTAIARNRFPSFATPLPVPSAAAAQENPTRVTVAENLSPAEVRVERQRLEADLQAEQWAEARTRLGRLERAQLPDLQQSLLLYRIQLHGAGGEETELTAALQLYLGRPGADLPALRRLAGQWQAEARQESALTLVRVVTERLPAARWAQDLRKKIEGDLLVAPDGKLPESVRP